jgi:putative transposase
MEPARRRLPHLYSGGVWLFITWHLHGSLPKARYPPPGAMNAGKAFVWMDRYLDTTKHGPQFLQDPEIARVVVDTLGRGQEMGLYDLRAWVVMRNHVHVLFRPHDHVPNVLQWLKGNTAREANRILGRTGVSFWQRESYDRWVRNEEEFQRIVRYIEHNPVRAGLVAEPGQYAWSSAGLPPGTWGSVEGD